MEELSSINILLKKFSKNTITSLPEFKIDIPSNCKVFVLGNSVEICLYFLLKNCIVYWFCQTENELEYIKYCFEYLKRKFNKITLYSGHPHDELQNCDEITDIVYIGNSNNSVHVSNVNFFLSKNNLCYRGIVICESFMKHFWEGYINNNLVTNIENKENKENYYIGRLTRPKLNIAVCSLAIGEKYKQCVKYGIITKQLYCKKHNYDFRDDEDVYDNTRPHAWSKIKLLQKCLLDNKNNYDYVVWLDADTLIMNPTRKLEDLIQSLSNNKDIFLARDWSRINSGVMFLKNTPRVHEFLDVLYAQTDFLHYSNWEQDAMIYMLENNIINCNDIIHVLPLYQQREINSYYFLFKNGDFLIHMAGCFRDNKNNGLDEMMERVCPIKMDNDTDESYNNRLKFIRELNQENI